MVISKLYGGVCKTLRGNSLVVEHRVVVMTAGSGQVDPKFNPMDSQFWIPNLWVWIQNKWEQKTLRS